MNQIVETLSQTGNWSAADVSTKRNTYSPRKQFKDILDGQREQTMPEKSKEQKTADAPVTGMETVYPQMQAVFPWTQFQEAVREQDAAAGVPSVLQSEGDFLTAGQGAAQQAAILQEESQLHIRENIVEGKGNLLDTKQPVLQAPAANDTEAILPLGHEIQTENSLGPALAAEGENAEAAPVFTAQKSSTQEDAKELYKISAEDSNNGIQQFAANSRSSTGYTHEVTGQKEVVTYSQESTQPDMQALKDTIVKHISEGKREFQVQLKPANLGTLLVNASYENGKTVISIVCMEAKTMHVMMQNAGELGSLIQSRLGSPTDVIVDVPHADYLDQHNEQESSQEHARSQQQENQKEEVHEGAEQFLQQLRLGLV
jgi:hypothetical protein